MCSRGISRILSYKPLSKLGVIDNNKKRESSQITMYIATIPKKFNYHSHVMINESVMATMFLVVLPNCRLV